MIEKNTVRDAVLWGVSTLDEAGCPDSGESARVLIAQAIGDRRTDVTASANDLVGTEEAEWYREAIGRRAGHEPLAYITGWFDFAGIGMVTDKRALVPDPASLYLVELLGDLIPEHGATLRVHEVGTGCGAIALAAKERFPSLVISASDIDPGAVELARENASRLDLDVPMSVCDGLPRGRYDVVVANLPYTDRQQRYLSIPPEYTEHQPAVALWAPGEDGLGLIRALVDQIRGQRQTRVKMLALQHAPSQTELVRALFGDAAVSEYRGDAYAAWTHGLLR